MRDQIRDFHEAQLHRVYGKYAGRVAGTDDTKQMGRLEIACPAVLGKETVWAMPCVPYAGPGVGFYFIPPVGAGVWVEFEGGDVSRAIWTGCYWSEGDLPSDADSTDVKLIATASASMKIDDNSGEVEVKNSAEASTVWGMDVSTSAGQASHSVGATGVTAQSPMGTGKVDVTDAGVVVNNGKFGVAAV